MNSKTKMIISLFLFSLFLILYPYTKEIKIYKAEDTNWKVFKKIQKIRKFDSKTFSFYEFSEINEEIKKLENKEISIRGFISIHKHEGEHVFLLSENPTDVCFMCNHDEQSFSFLLEPEKKDSKIYNLKKDSYVTIKGIFTINERSEHTMFSLKSASLIQLHKGQD